MILDQLEKKQREQRQRRQKQLQRKYMNYVLRYIGIPVLLEFIIESLNRKSIVSGVGYLFERPSLFVFNTLIIMLTVSIALFFKREIFVFTTVCAVWLIFGIVNFFVLSVRVTPFSAVDITLLESALKVSGHYLTAFNVAMIALAAVLVVGSLVCLFRMAPKHSHTTQKKVIVAGLCVAIVISALAFIRSRSNSVQALSKNFTNISEAYENYGFVYCFTNSIIDTGISKPEEYSKEAVEEVLAGIPSSTGAPAVKPNIIFIQLESFFDVDTLKSLKLSEDPIPNFHRLQKEYSKGLLTVPTVGAGTVNTEFEVLTGMSQKDFGASEYPYKTILRDTTSESVCYDLKYLGYKTHCVHNNEGTFYGRNKVFANLGFDTFTSMEYMNDLEDNPNGWKKDKVLTREILGTLDSTPGTDFTLGITVQSHGKYGRFSVDKAKIKVEKAPEGMEEDYLYYVSQLKEVDDMIGELVDALSKRNEKTVLVLYGDHLPSLDIEKKDLKDSNLYQTQYVVWDNMGLEKMEENLSSYQLYPEILKRVNITAGNITRYHQNAEWKTKTYHENLKMLEYDMLYGENYAHGGKNPYQPTALQMGTKPVQISKVSKNEKGYLIEGSGFTPFVHLYFQGEKVDATWIDSAHLQVEEELAYDAEAAKEPAPTPDGEGNLDKKKIPNGFFLQVKTDGGTVLSESNVLKWESTGLGVTPVPAVSGIPAGGTQVPAASAAPAGGTQIPAASSAPASVN